MQMKYTQWAKQKPQAVKEKNFLEKENTNGKVIMWEKNTSTEIKEMLIKTGCKYYRFTNKQKLQKSDAE